MALNDIALAHQAANYAVNVRAQDGLLVGEVLRDGILVWTSPLTTREKRARDLPQAHIDALCGLYDGPRH